jgi:hypothetical protein
MKKLFLIASLLINLMMYSQERFVREYSYCISNTNGVNSEPQPFNTVAIFNDDEEFNHLIYLNGVKFKFMQISDTEKKTTTKGKEAYQGFEAIRESDGKLVYIQLFEEGNLRIIVNSKDFVEYLNLEE